jgi:hypothetical protein
VEVERAVLLRHQDGQTEKRSHLPIWQSWSKFGALG